jgi:hypothetical protein
MSFFGGPFGGYGGMPPAASGGLDEYRPNTTGSYQHQPLPTNAPKTPMDLYEKKEDRKTLGTIISTVLAGAAALIFIRHVQTLRAGEGFMSSMFSPNSRDGLKEASRTLYRDIKTSHQKQKWVQEIDEHASYIKQMNSVKNKTPEQKLQRQKSIQALKALIYGKETGLGIDRNDPLLKWDPPKGWGRIMPFGPNGFNWTLGRVSNGSLLHRYSQPGEVRTIVKAHKLLQSRHVDKLEKKAIRNTVPFGSSETLVDDALSSVSSSASTLREAPSLMPQLTHDISIDAQTKVLNHRAPLSKGGTEKTIATHFETRHSLNKDEKKKLLKEIHTLKEAHRKELKPFEKEKTHVANITNLSNAGDETDRIGNLSLIRKEAAKRLKSLGEDKPVNAAHVTFYKKIDEITKRHADSSAERIKLYESLEEQIKWLNSKETTIKNKIELSQRLRNTMNEESK